MIWGFYMWAQKGGFEQRDVHGPQILPRLRAGTEAELVRTTQGHLHDYSVQVPPGGRVVPPAPLSMRGGMLQLVPLGA